MSTLAGMPITMLSGFGCAECGGSCTLGATTIEDVKNFFMGNGPNGLPKYVKHVKNIGLYKNPGEAMYTHVKAGDTIGRVVGINAKGNWAKLESGDWINLSPGVIEGYHIVYLSTAPPKSVSDAVGREAEKVVDAVADALPLTQLKWILGIAVVAGLAIVSYKLFPEETKGAFKSTKAKLKAA